MYSVDVLKCISVWCGCVEVYMYAGWVWIMEQKEI